MMNGLSVDHQEMLVSESHVHDGDHEGREGEGAAGSLRELSGFDLRQLAETFPGVVFLCDCDEAWTLLFVNHQIEELSGFAPEELRSGRLRFADLCHPMDRERVESTIREAVASRRFYTVQYRLRRKDGSVRWVEERGSTVDAGGENVVLQGCVSDITDRKNAERKAAANEELATLALEGAGLATWHWDVRNGTARVSDHWAAILGYGTGEVRTELSAWLQQIHPEDRQDVQRALAQHLAGEQDAFEIEYRIRRKDATWAWVQSKGRVLEWDGSGQPIRAAGTHLDISERMETEVKHRYVLETAIDGFWVVGVDGWVQEANAAAAAMLGYRQQELVGLHVSDIDVHEDPEDVRRHFEAIRRGAATRFEACHRRKDGSIVDVEVSVSYLPYGGGQIIAFVRDVGDRKKAEVALAESERRFRELYENAPIGIFTTSADGRALAVNRVMAEILGCGTTEEAIRHYQDLARQLYVDADQRQRFIQLMREHGWVEGFEYEARTADGRRIWLDMCARVAGVDDGGGFVIEGFTQDITARKEVEQALHESERRYRLLAENFPNGAIFLFDRDLRYTFCAGTELDRVGLRTEDIVGCQMRDVWPAEIADRFESLSQQVLAGESGCAELAYANKLYGAYAIPIRNDAGSISEGLVVAINISEQRELEEQLRQAQKMEAIGVLAGGIAHDFNNILFAILGYADLAQSFVDEAHPVRSMLDEIVSSSLRASELVKQILTYARRTERRRKNIDIVPVVKEVEKLIRSTLPANIEIELDMRTPRAVVNADPTEVHQLLMNLCANAGHALAETGGRLTVRLESDHRPRSPSGSLDGVGSSTHHCLEVEDTGPGIPAEIHDRIFDPFFTTKDAGEGTGMGLAVVHSVVEELGGTIDVSSTPGEGSCFRVLLPAVLGEPNAVSKPASELPKGSERLLVVDDEPMIVDVTRQMLALLGYRVTAFTNSPEALEHFREHSAEYDAAVLDQAMPKMRGSELARVMLELRPDFPIMIVTGYSESFSERDAKRLGVRRYLEKPVRKEALAKGVREVLDASSTR